MATAEKIKKYESGHGLVGESKLLCSSGKFSEASALSVKNFPGPSYKRGEAPCQTPSEEKNF